MSGRGSVLGWIVLRRATEERRWVPDFDGEVHTSRVRADEALGLATDAGHQVVLAELVWVRDAPTLVDPAPSGMCERRPDGPQCIVPDHVHRRIYHGAANHG